MVRSLIAIIIIMLLGGCAHWRFPAQGGTCPSDYPIKGNVESGYYHSPFDSYYYHTHAEFCFKNSKIARQHGYTRTPR